MFQDKGAATATLIAETIVTITMFLYGRKYIRIKRFDSHYVKCLLGGAVMAIILYILRTLSLSPWINIWLLPLVGIVIYILFMYLRKDSFYKYAESLIAMKLHKS